MNRFFRWLAGATLIAALTSTQAAPARHASLPILPGARPDGSVLLPNQWSLRPAGYQVKLGDFPVNIAVDPSGRYAAVLHSGYGQHEVIVVNVDSRRVVSRVDLNQTFYGLAFSPDGSRLYCSGAGDEVIYVFDFKKGYLTEDHRIHLRPVRERGVPAGLVVSRDGKRLWVAEPWGQDVSEVTLDGSVPVRHIPMTKTLLHESHFQAPPSNPYLAAAVQRAEALQDPTQPNDPFPYAVVEDARRNRLYVSLWAQASVAVVDLATHRVIARWPTQEHPNELLLDRSGNRLFVANANRNTVSVLDPATGKTIETLSTGLYPHSLPGATPNSLALSPDGSLLFVANANNNNVAVFDVSKPDASRSLGLIPVGWYPTSVRVTPDGRRLLVANGKGLSSLANVQGPQPIRHGIPHTSVQYIGGLFRGTLSIIDLRHGERFTAQMKRWTAQAYQCSPLRADASAIGHRSPNNPIPARVGGPSPLKYCIYILKENRTYDQVLGDVRRGNGDPNLCLFGEDVTPNEHALVRQFVLLDNFYVNSEVSADGHEWSMGAYATDFVEKTWPLNYGHNTRGKFPYPSEGHFRIAWPSNGYLWDRAREAGITYRSYGEFITNGKTPADPSHTAIPALVGHFDPDYRGWDLNYPDVKRAARFIHDLHEYEKAGTMPRLQILRLPNDHTYGTSRGKLTPRAMVADNDLALGQLVDAVSHSKFWPQTAIFVVEDDAQNGPDHVDAHRTTAYVFSPYVRHDVVDSTMYSTCSMLRTMELILGLQPMTEFDAAAMPMYNSFQAKPNLEPYTFLPARINLHKRNTALAWGAAASAQMDFSQEDRANEQKLNEVIWHSVKGAKQPMPPPVHAAFVLAHADDDD